MKPRPITDADLELFPGKKKIFKCPPGLENCTDVEVIKSDHAIRIPWVLEKAELVMNNLTEHESKDMTFWLTIYGQGMPPVDLFVFDRPIEGIAPLSQSAEENDLKSFK